MLIDKTEIARHREISRSVSDKKINPHIEDAEFLDLKPLLGNELYNDLVSNQPQEKYQNLLNPFTYSYDGFSYTHQGLKKVLSLFSNARYVLFGSYTDTAFGFVQKANQDSQPVPNEFKRNVHKKDKQAALQYFDEVALFMSRFSEVYTLWNRDCGKIRGGFRISKISR